MGRGARVSEFFLQRIQISKKKFIGGGGGVGWWGGLRWEYRLMDR